MRRKTRPFALLLAALVIAQPACLDSTKMSGRPAPHFKPGFNLFTPEQDIELGRQSAQEIAGEMPLLNDQTTVNFVRALGAKLAAQAPGHDFPYQFSVVASGEINAFALPGGFIYVNAGAIAAARNEAELAGVMAHEIAHVALRHGTNQASKAYIAQAGLGILSTIAGGADSPQLSQIVESIGGAGANMLFLKFGRTAETEADLEGARILAAAGYDPRDMARFFETLDRMSEGERPPEMLSDHPDPGNRIAAINEILPSLKLASNPVRDTEDFQRVKARLAGSALRSSPEPARVGPRDPNDMKPTARPEPPSGSYSQYRSPDGSYTFRAPDNWDALSTDGGETNLIFAPPGSYGEVNGSVYVTHGIFVGAVQPPAGDLESAVNIFVREQIRANPDFSIRGEPQAITFSDGRQGYAVEVAGPSTVTGVVEIDVIYTTVTSDGRLFYLITMAPEDEYERYKPAFEQIIRSLKFGR